MPSLILTILTPAPKATEIRCRFFKIHVFQAYYLFKEVATPILIKLFIVELQMNSNSKIEIIQQGKKRTLPESSNNDIPAWFNWAISNAPSSHFVSVKDCQIHYLLWDDASDTKKSGSILFVHGGAAHSHWWSFLAPFFLKSYKVAALDLSGMGDSGRRQEYNAGLRAEEIYSVIEDANLGRSTYVIGPVSYTHLTLPTILLV